MVESLPGVMTLFLQLRVIADKARVDVGELTAGAAKYTDAFATTGGIRVAFDGNQSIIAEALDYSHMPFSTPCIDHENEATAQAGEVLFDILRSPSGDVLTTGLVPVG